MTAIAALQRSFYPTTQVNPADSKKDLEIEEIATPNLQYLHIALDPQKYNFETVTSPQKSVFLILSPFLLINGGYYEKDGNPSGLVISKGKVIHPFSQNELLSGVFSIKNGKASISWSKDYQEDPGITFAVQNGPLIIEPGGKKGIHACGEKTAERTIVAVDKKGKVHLMVLKSPVTLKEAQDFIMQKIPDVSAALNLDGGPSSYFSLHMKEHHSSFGLADQLPYFIKISPK